MGATLKRAAFCALFFKALAPLHLRLRVARSPLFSPHFGGFYEVFDSSELRCSTSQRRKQGSEDGSIFCRDPPFSFHQSLGSGIQTSDAVSEFCALVIHEDYQRRETQMTRMEKSTQERLREIMLANARTTVMPPSRRPLQRLAHLKNRLHRIRHKIKMPT